MRAIAGVLGAWLLLVVLFYGLPVYKADTRELCWLADNAYPWEEQTLLVWRCIATTERKAANGKLQQTTDK